MATKKINYKSDFELIYTLTDNEGNPLSVPDNPWELWLSVGNPLGTNVRKFIAKYDGGDYTNCRVQDDTIIVIADNHKLPTGHLWTTFIDYQPNSDFPDGDKKIYTPQPCNVELITGAGDAPTETDIEILANYVVFEHEYTAGQGITIENDVISSTGESYTAGNQIVIDEGTINVAVPFTDMVEQHDTDIHLMGIDIDSLDRRTTAVEESVETKASASDVTALGNRVTAVEGSITDLTVTDPALRQSDATTSKEIGKVAEFSDSGDHYINPQTLQPLPSTVPELNVGDINMDGVFKEGMNQKYALPHADNGVKARADYVLADEADVTQLQSDVQSKADASTVTNLEGRVEVVETALPTKASTSSVNAIDGRVTTLENTYEDTMNIANNQLHELIDGKAMIASALTDRGYPTAPTDSSASMAQKIENMAYDAGWLAQIGYTEENNASIKALAERSKTIKEQLEGHYIDNLKNVTGIAFCPVFNLTWEPENNVTGFFSGSDVVFVPDLNISTFNTLATIFKNCASLRYVGKLTLNSSLRGFYDTFTGCVALERIEMIDMTGRPAIGMKEGVNYEFTGVNKLHYMFLKNIGSDENMTPNKIVLNAKNWGSTGEGLQSMVDTLITYSYDRYTAGWSSMDLYLHQNAIARLTSAQIAEITAKGYSIISLNTN